MRSIFRLGAVAAIVLVAAFWIRSDVSGQAGPTPSTKNGEWPMYTADLRGSKYSPLDQINASNFGKLELAWRFKTDNLGTRPEYKLEGTPIMVKGVVYATGGTRRSVVALDGKTGEVIWVHSYREGMRAAVSPRQLSGRGLSYWTDGKGDDRILYVTTGYRLISLNARNGSMISSFGKNGVVDLKEGAVFGNRQPIDLESGEIGLHATPTVVKDTVLIGSSFKEGMTVPTHNNTKGLVRAFDVRTGKVLWTFNTIPRPGEFGSETWENDSWAINGNTGVWGQITVDEDAGLVYLPVESPTSDYYGGHRPGNNLFGESLVAVDLKTGVRKWHFQFVHHPVWDFDIPGWPLLVDAVVNGQPRKLVAQPSKQGWLYVFDRITGQPIWPMPETPVPQSDVPGEKTSPTQPIPSRPAPYSRTFIGIDDLIDFTPEMRQQALQVLKNYRWEPSPFVPPIVATRTGKLGAMNVGAAGGGVNWAGGAFDPETHTVYVQATNSWVFTEGLRASPPGFSDIRYVAGVEGTDFVVNDGPGFGTAADAPQRGRGQAPPPAQPPAARGATPAAAPPTPTGTAVQGLLLLKPPYGVVAAINLDSGDTLWKVPHGETPDNVRNHPALQGMTIPKTGQMGLNVGLLVTKTLVVGGDLAVTTPPGRPRGAMLRAYDKKTGAQVGEVWMPAQQSGSPMSYSIDGRQYIIVAVSGGNYSGEYLAFALPQSAVTSSSAGR